MSEMLDSNKENIQKQTILNIDSDDEISDYSDSNNISDSESSDDNGEVIYMEQEKSTDYARNPYTGRNIKIGSRLWKQLLKEGSINNNCDLVIENKKMTNKEVCQLTTKSAIDVVLNCIDEISKDTDELVDLNEKDYNKKMADIEKKLKFLIHTKLLSKKKKKTVEFYEE